MMCYMQRLHSFPTEVDKPRVRVPKTTKSSRCYGLQLNGYNMLKSPSTATSTPFILTATSDLHT